MVDKVWYDWQSRDPVNMENFFGGSAQHIESVDAYNQYPNGGPPYLSVSTCRFSLSGSSQADSIAGYNDPGRWTVPGSHDRRRDEYNRGLLVLCIRVKCAPIQCRSES
jgi:hypothetical protein